MVTSSAKTVSLDEFIVPCVVLLSAVGVAASIL